MPPPASQKRTQLGLWSTLAASMVELYVVGPDKRSPPTEFRIFKAGVNHSDKGDFLFDDEAATSVMGAYQEKGVDVSIDYDHQALRAGDIKAPAAGWCALEVRNGELWATNVRWTPTAIEHLEKAEYRYFSPLFTFDDRTGRITHVINSALTNTPALHHIDALVAASANTQVEEERNMNELEKALARIAELERQATAKDQEIGTLKGQNAIAALSSTVGLAATASPDEVRSRVATLVIFRRDVVALSGKDSDAAAIGALTAMKEQAAEVVDLRQKADAAVTAALAAEFGAELDKLSTKGQEGKFLPPAARERAEAMAKKLGGGKFTREGIEEAKAYLGFMCVPGEPKERKAEESDAITALSATEREIAENTGTSLESKRAYKKRVAERAR